MKSRNYRFLLGCLMLASLLPLVGLAQTPVPQDPRIRMGKLANGMTYYLRKNAEPAQRAELRLAVKTGSVLEDDDQQGLAHFCEHMAFNGSAHFQKQELVDYLEGIGVKFGPHLNAYTSFDETVYMIQVPTDNPAIMDKGLLVLEDWASGLSFDPVEIDKERGVVVEEWRLRTGADSRLQQKYLPVLMNGSHYAKRLPIGDPELIKTFPYEAVKRFYEKWYRPDLMGVMVVGDIDLDAMEAQIKKRFGSIPGHAGLIEVPKYPSVAHDDVRAVTATDKDASNTVVEIMHKFPEEHLGDVEDFPRLVKDRLIREMLSKRLQKLQTTGESPLLFTIFSTGRYLGRSSGHAFTAFGLTNPESARKGLKVLIDELERAKRHGFVASELERAKLTLIADDERAVNEVDKTESRQWVNNLVGSFLSGTSSASPEWRLSQLQAILPSITLEDLHARLKSVTKPTNTVIVAYGPETKTADYPTDAESIAMFKASLAGQYSAYAEEEDRRPLIEKPIKPVPASSKVTNATVGVTEITFPNGVKVVLKPTDFQADEVYMTGFRKGGYAMASDADLPSAMASSTIQENAGAGAFNAAALEAKLAGKNAELYIYMESDWEQIYGNSSAKDLEILLQRCYLSLAFPRQDDEAFEAYLENAKTMLSFHNGPEGAFQDSSWLVYNNHHPRALIEDEAFIARVNAVTAYKFFKSRFANMHGFTFVLVGSFETEKLMPMLEKYIGGLPGKKKQAAWVDRGIRIPQGKVDCSVKVGEDPKSMVSIIYSGLGKPEAKEVFHVKFMSDVLAIMLRENMREDKGGVYGVRVAPDFMKTPVPMYDFSIDFGCAPERVDELIAAMNSEIKRLQTEGPSEKNMEKVRETIRRTDETNLRDNEHWLDALSETLRLGGNIENLLKVAEMAKAITAAEVQSAAKKYLDGENRIKVVLYPAQ